MEFSSLFIFSQGEHTMSNSKESKFQRDLVSDIYDRFPGCIVQKMDPTYRRGFPDLMIFYGKKWASLECKKSEADMVHSKVVQPWQSHWVEKLDAMGFSSYIYPENKEDILDAVQRYLDT